MAKTKPTKNNSAHFRRTSEQSQSHRSINTSLGLNIGQCHTPRSATARLSPSAYTKFSPHGPPTLSRSDTRGPEWEPMYLLRAESGLGASFVCLMVDDAATHIRVLCLPRGQITRSDKDDECARQRPKFHHGLIPLC
ncbi:hypothetical protein V8F06_013435 [Rhypophila decipiens]